MGSATGSLSGTERHFPTFLFPLLSFSCFSFFFFASFNFSFQGWGGDDEDGDAVQLQEHLQWRANRSAEAWYLEVYVKYIKYLRQGSWKYISHINGFDGWNPAPEDTFEECTSCEEELRANPSHFNQLFDLSTDPLEEVFSPKIFNPILFSIILILAPEHFPVITLFQHNLAEEEPERAALMAERLMELGATVVIKSLCSILLCTI